MENYFIIHGSFGSPFSNWSSWLYDFIKNEGKQAYVPDFPIGVKYQNYENWSKLLKYYLDTEQILLPNAGHINTESGYDTFEDIVSYL